MVDREVNIWRTGLGPSWADMETLGKRIRALREARSLSQEQLADSIGTKKSTVSSWERDAVKDITLPLFFALCDALDCDPRYLAMGHNDRLSPPVRGFPTSDSGRFRLRARKKTNDT